VSLPPALKAQLRDRLRRDPSPPRPRRAAEALWLSASAVAAMVLLFLQLGGAHVGARPAPFLAGVLAGWGVLAAVATVAALHRGRSMLDPPRSRLILTATLVPAAAFAWMLLWNALYPQTLAPTPGRPGFRCLGVTLLLAAWPLVALALTRRRTAIARGALVGAALGVAMAASAGALVALWCPIADPAHTAVGHMLPFVLLAALGAIIGARIVAMSGR
jgi:hypothetical protein